MHTLTRAFSDFIYSPFIFCFKGTTGRRENLSWNVDLFLLPGPNFTKLPTVTQRRKMTQTGFGNSTVNYESWKIIKCVTNVV